VAAAGRPEAKPKKPVKRAAGQKEMLLPPAARRKPRCPRKRPKNPPPSEKPAEYRSPLAADLMRTPNTNTFDLRRFVVAQQPVYATALAELEAGAKRSHWMWFIFPQAEGLGHSAIAQRYAIRSLDEAIAYLAHPLLGARLAECTRAMLAASGSAHSILGSPDDLKFRSSMTLFGTADAGGLYREAVRRFFDGEEDPRTVAIVKGRRKA
jgi:uncharacterized protein (DUF1810 family)